MGGGNGGGNGGGGQVGDRTDVDGGGLQCRWVSSVDGLVTGGDSSCEGAAHGWRGWAEWALS